MKKEVKKTERKQVLQVEKVVIQQEETDDFYSVEMLDDEIENDSINSAEYGFMTGYLSA